MTAAGKNTAVDDRRAFAQSQLPMTRDPHDVDWSSVVHSDPGISGGTPVFRGTRACRRRRCSTTWKVARRSIGSWISFRPSRERRPLPPCGIAIVARATGMSRTRIARGIVEMESDEPLDAHRMRRPGGGRKRIVDTDPTLVSDLTVLLEPITAGERDDSPLRWASKSMSKLTAEL